MRRAVCMHNREAACGTADFYALNPMSRVIWVVVVVRYKQCQERVGFERGVAA